MSGKAAALKGWIELVANVALIATCLCVIGLVRDYTKRRAAATITAEDGLSRGLPMPDIEGVKYNQASRTLLLVLNSDCASCRESLGFYDRLTRAAATNPTLKCVAVFRSDDLKSSDFISENKLDIQRATVNEFRQLYVTVTPTLIVVDRSGKVVDFWVGKIPQGSQEDVIRSIL